MKILVITHLFLPDRGGGASVFSDLCFGLAERGHEVDVLAGYPYYPEWRNKSGANLWRVTKEFENGLNLVRYGFFIPSRPSSLVQRLLYEASFAVSLLRSLWGTRRYNLVMVYCPLLGSLAFAVLRKWMVGDPLWLNIQDIPADAAAASGISKSRLFNRAASIIQRFLFRQADCVSTISPIMARRVERIVGGGINAVLLPNWLNRSMEDNITRYAKSLRESATTKIPTLLYAGNIGKKQGLLDFCRYLSTQELSFKFRIYGDGSEAGSLKTWIDTCSDGRFSMDSFLPEEEFIEALYQTDYFLITETENVGASFIPSKLIPCIATGTPVIAICSEEGPLGAEVTSHNLGVVISWGETPSIRRLLDINTIGSREYQSWQEGCLQRSCVYRRDEALNKVEAQARKLIRLE